MMLTARRLTTACCGFSPRAKGIMAVVGGFLVHFTLGTVYTFGNMNSYITSYIRQNNDDVTYASTMFIFSFAILGQASTMWLGGLLNYHMGARMTVSLGSWLMTFGVVTTYFAIKLGLYTTILTYGFIFGLGIGIPYAVALSTAISWWPDNAGLVGGIVMAGYGGGSFVFNLVQTSFVNPRNEKPDTNSTIGEKFFSQPDILDRVPNVFLLIGCIYGAMQIVGIALIWPAPVAPTPQPPEEPLIPLNNRRRSSRFGSVQVVEFQVTQPAPLVSLDKTPREAIKSKDFYVLWLNFFFNSGCVVIVTTMYKAFGETFISNDIFLSLIGSLAAVINAAGRVGWGQLLDIFSYKLLMLCQTMLMFALLISFAFTPSLGRVGYAVWVCALFAVYAGNFSLVPICVSKTFGRTHMAINYGIIFSANAVASIGGAFLLNVLKSRMGWMGTFALGAGCAACSFGITWFFSGRMFVKKRRPPTSEKA